MKNKILKISVLLSLIFTFTTNTSNAKEIELNKWQPESIANTPYKKSYMLGEKLDLAGLKINFVRYIKTDNKVEEEVKEVKMLPNTIKNGWLLVDNIFRFTEIGNYRVSIQLKLLDPSLQYDFLYPEKVEVDENNFIIKKSIQIDKNKKLTEADTNKNETIDDNKIILDEENQEE